MNTITKALQLINFSLQVTVLGMWLWIAYILMWAVSGQAPMINLFAGITFISCLVVASLIVVTWHK